MSTPALGAGGGLLTHTDQKIFCHGGMDGTDAVSNVMKLGQHMDQFWPVPVHSLTSVMLPEMALDWAKEHLASWCLAQPVGWQLLESWAAGILPGREPCAWGEPCAASSCQQLVTW